MYIHLTLYLAYFAIYKYKMWGFLHFSMVKSLTGPGKEFKVQKEMVQF